MNFTMDFQSFGFSEFLWLNIFLRFPLGRLVRVPPSQPNILHNFLRDYRWENSHCRAHKAIVKILGQKEISKRNLIMKKLRSFNEILSIDYGHFFIFLSYVLHYVLGDIYFVNISPVFVKSFFFLPTILYFFYGNCSSAIIRLR
jgi:hypothetical protein